MKLLSGNVSRFLILIPLLIALPFFIWIVMSQRQDLRKRASYSTEICWNRVASSGGQYQWPDSCKGVRTPDMNCAALLVPLTEDELRQYNEWVASGSAVLEQCRPSILSSRINWRTPYAFLAAEDLSILANGREFTASQASSLAVHSDPGNPDYTTLEIEWNESNTEMRLYIYFYAETIAGSNPPRRQWGVSSIRTYNGNTPGDWIFYNYRTSLGNIGSPYISPMLNLTSNEPGGLPGELKIKNLQMQAFLQEQTLTPTPPTPTPVIDCNTDADCPSGYTCRSTPPGGCPSIIVNGVEQTSSCAHRPFCYPPTSLTPTPKPGCYYQQVQCFRAPCNPILVCPSPPTPVTESYCMQFPYTQCPAPCVRRASCTMCMDIGCHAPSTPTPTPTVTATPTNTPTPTPASLSDLVIDDIILERTSPPYQSCESYKFTVKVKNIGTGYAPTSILKILLDPAQPQALDSCTHTQLFRETNSQIYDNDPVLGDVLSPGATAYIYNYFNPMESGSVTITAQADYFNVASETNETNNNMSKTFTVTRAYATPTPTPTPAPQTMTFALKLGGVTDGSAEGAKISVKFQKRDGATTQLSQPLVLHHTSNGIYEASVVLNNPMPAGTQFRLLIKGEKHIAVKFCRQVGQTAPCGDDEYITASNSLVYGADLTGIPLPPGDIYQQDGKADASDFEKIMTLMNTSCSSLTDAQKMTADLDYNGCVNVRDAFLMRQTLQTRYDE
jgi:CARDB